MAPVTFLKRHHRFVSLFGAFILFTTFVVKDQLKDYQKDLLADIQLARLQYLINHDTDAVSETVETLEYIRRIEPVANLHIDRESTIFLRPQITTDFRNLSALGSEYNNAIGLNSALAVNAELNATQKNIDENRVDIDKVSKGVMSVVDAGSDRPLTASEHADVTKLHEIATAFAKSVPAFVGKVLEQAESEEQKRKRRYDFTATMSYFLYPFGWALSFIGKFFEPGADEVGGD